MTASTIDIRLDTALSRFGLHLAVFFSGFITMALEMLIGRTFIPFFGGTIYTWGALISVFLTGMTLGYLLGGKMADRLPSVGMLASLFLLSGIFVLVVPMFGEDAINEILNVIDDMRYAALVAAILLACCPAAVLAAVSPYCVRLLLDSKERSGSVSGRLSGLAAAGSIVGTLGTSFYFIPSFGTRMIYGVLAAMSVAMALILVFFWRFPPGRRAGRAPASVLIILSLAGFLGVGHAPDAHAQQKSLLLMKDGLLEKVESEYNTILVEKQGAFVTMAFGYRSNRYVESVMNLASPLHFPVSYTRYMTCALLFHPGNVRRIALVGLGGGRTISYLVSSLPSVTAEVAELDPAVIDLAKRYFDVADSPRLRIRNKDGRVFLNQSRDKFDVILLDAYRGPFVPFHLTTQEFYRLVKSRLDTGGVVAQNVEPSTLFFDSAYATMKSVFENVDAFPAGGNVVLIGYGGARLTDAQLQRKAAQLQAAFHFKYDITELARARESVTLSPKAQVLTDDFAPVEMLKTVKRHNEKRQ